MKKILFGILLLGLSVTACRQQPEAAEEHAHEDVKLMITAYDQGFEVFAEADPFVQGTQSEILAHITHLEAFEALQQGTVVLSLIVGENGIRQPQDAPERPGIYRFNLQPQQAGSGRLFFDIEYQGETFRVDGGPIRVYDDEHAALHHADDAHEAHPTALSFTKEQAWLVNLRTAPVITKAIGVVIPAVGKLLPEQGNKIVLSARAPGIVNFANASLYEGIDLGSGEVLMNISGEGLAEGNALQRYQQARNNMERARADYQRMEALAEDQIVSQSELLQAKNEYDNARAVFESLSENFTEGGQQVRSPMEGFLSQLMVAPGEYVQAGQPLAEVMHRKGAVIKAEVQQRYANLLPHLATANISGPDGKNHTLEALDGRIMSFAQNISETSHLLPVYLKVNQPPEWVTGTLLDVYLKTGQTQERLVVPDEAILEEQGYYFVFVQIHPESFLKKEVQVGQSDGEYTEIISGLSQGERIISQGAALVKMAAASGTIDPHSGHVH
ncbi:MAG: efflux RND transporter periplasmic adaptor subunit [Bacteroidales bacterium]